MLALLCLQASLRPPTCVLRPINSDNARPFCITAAAGTELARATLVVYVIILRLDSGSLLKIGTQPGHSHFVRDLTQPNKGFNPLKTCVFAKHSFANYPTTIRSLRPEEPSSST